MSHVNHPRVQVETYVVYPAAYDQMGNSDRDMWCLTVTNGHRWGWSISRGRGMTSGGMHMNRKGEFIHESRGDGKNKHRRWPLEVALDIALKNVDGIRLNGSTAADVAARWPIETEETP